MRAHHCLIAGPSGGGKTTLLREIHSRFDGVSVWIRRGARDGDAPAGRTAGGIVGLRSAVEAASSWDSVSVVLETDGSVGDVHEAVAHVRRLAADVHEVTDGAVGTQLVLDEAHAFLPDSEADSGPGNPVRDALHEDRDRGLKVCIASQDPSDLYYPPIKQVAWIVWVGPTRVFNRGFLRYFGLQDVSLPDRRFEYVTLRPTDPPEVVARGETTERFA